MKPNYKRIRELELELDLREPDEADGQEVFLQWHAAQDEAERYPEEAMSE